MGRKKTTVTTTDQVTAQAQQTQEANPPDAKPELAKVEVVAVEMPVSSALSMIRIRGAREHNLRNVSVDLPRGRLICMTGVSGSGKSSLAFDTLFAEGQRRYMESFSAYARQFMGDLERPDVDKISGLSPVISIEQKTTNRNPRSTVGTVTEVYDFMRLLFARVADAYSYNTGKKMEKFSEEEIADHIHKTFSHTRAQRKNAIRSIQNS